MQNSKKEISSYAYFGLLAGLISSIFFVVGILLLSFSASGTKLNSTMSTILGLFLFWKSLLVGFILGFLYKKTKIDKNFSIKFLGLYLGRFYGMLVGGFLGYKIGDFLGLILGALIFYFIGRWLGSLLSFQINNQLDKWFVIKEYNYEINQKIPKILTQNKFITLLYTVFIPASFVSIAFMLNFLGIEIASIQEWLVSARIVVGVLSVFTIAFPWWIKKRGMGKNRTSPLPPEFSMTWIGSTFSIFPVIYGFMLFFIFGASITELCIFALVSSITAIVWSKNTAVTQPNA